MTRLLPALLARTALPGLCALGLRRTSLASSQMDAPLITLDSPANTTDVCAFVSRGYDDAGGPNPRKYLTTALAVYPHEDPGIGPNKFNYDDAVLYEIHVALGDLLRAEPLKRIEEGLRSAYIVGRETLNGVECNHVAWQTDEVDAEGWFSIGDVALLQRAVVA